MTLCIDAHHVAAWIRLVRLIRAHGGDPDVYRPETIQYWIAQGWPPERIVTEILQVPQSS